VKRTITRRTIWHPGAEFEVSPHTIDLALVAHSAAIETLQIDLVAKAWVGMFGALLEPGTDTSPLMWSADGPGGEAEIKRAYSALFGRFFGRAVLRHEHGCFGLRQVRDGMELSPGIELHRKIPGLKGDLPDWVGWVPARGCFTICEAKGSYEKASWIGRHPPILNAATDQLDRVQVLDATGVRLQTKNWVVASRWGTSINGKETTIITKDPLTDGRALSKADAERVEREASAFWLADLLAGLGQPTLAAALRGDSGLPSHDDTADVAIFRDRKVYAALLADGLGVVPLRGVRRRERFDLLREIASDANAKVAVVAIDATVVRDAKAREWVPDEAPELDDEGRTIISDGVVLTWDVDALEL
jgi:hypothetical protein